MDLKKIRETLARLTEVVDGWKEDETIGSLERDWTLEKLRSLYEAIRFADLTEEANPVPAPAETEKTNESETPAEETALENAGLDLSEMLALEPEVASEQGAVSEPEPAPASEPEPVSESEPASVLEPEPVSVPTPASEPEPEPASESGCEPLPAPVSEPALAPEPAEPVVKQSDALAHKTTLFGPEEEDDAMRHRRKQRVIMSLYGDEAGVRFDSESAPVARPVRPGRAERADAEKKDTVTFEEISVETVVSDDPMPMPGFQSTGIPADRETSPAPVGNVLGEVINHDVKTLADTIEPPRDVATDLRRKAPVYDLRQAVGINDRFLLIRDLFGGDSEAYDTLMQRLNAFENLDDCVIYLTENYTWNANSDSVRLLMELLERKFA